MKQYHIEQQIFDDCIWQDGTSTTHGDGWVIVETQQQIDDICASLTGGGDVWFADGKLYSTGAAPSVYHRYDKQKKQWQLDATAQQQTEQQQFQAAKTAKLAALNAEAQAYINRAAGIDQLPRFEVDTWTLQALEAKAWAADNTASTPTLDRIAAARSIPADLLKQKALEKALAYEQLTATVVGLRQAIETKIKKAADMAELEAIEFAFGTGGDAEA